MQVLDGNGVPMSTGMGWHVPAPRPTDEQLIGSSLAPVIDAHRSSRYVTPDALGPHDDPDDTELVQWALLVSRVIGRPLWLDREYRCGGMGGVLEAQQDQVIEGNGPHRPGLRWSVKSALESHDLAIYNQHAISLTHAPGVQRFTVRNLQINGGQADVDWTAADDPTLWNVLQNSPSYSGISTVNHSGRAFPDEVTLENVHIHDMPGVCLYGHARMRCSNLTIGNSVGNRPIYGFYGTCHGLRTYGFSRFSFAQIYAKGTFIDGWTYRSEGHAHPISPTQQYVFASLFGSGQGQDFGTGCLQLDNIDWDSAGSNFFVGFEADTNCRVTGSVRNMRSFRAAPTNRGSYTLDVDLTTENSLPPDLASFGMANVRAARVRQINRSTTDKFAADWSHTSAAYEQWKSLIHLPPSISVARKPHHAVDHEQRVTLCIDNDWPQWLLLHIPDLTIDDGGVRRLRTAAEVVPTYIRLSGRVDNRLSAWISIMPGIGQSFQPGRGELESLPIRIIIDDLACNVIPPGGVQGNSPHSLYSNLFVPRVRHRLQSTVGVPGG